MQLNIPVLNILKLEFLLLLLRNFKYTPVKSSISIPSMLITVHHAQPKLECKKTYEITIWEVAGPKKGCCQSVFETLILCFVSSFYSVFTVGIAHSA